MKKTYMTLLAVLAVLTASADAPNGSGTYYQAANGKKGAALKSALRRIVQTTVERSYDDLWTDFRTTDKRSDGKVWDMYSSITNFTFGTDQAGSFQKEGDVYNREHSFPKSWFGGEIKPMYTDLHHMYPTDGYVNNRRGNLPFGTTNGETYKSSGGFSKVGACTYNGYTGEVFEPNDEYKGDLARTYFYMVTRYEEKLADWYNNNSEARTTLNGTTYPAFQTWQLNMLMEWATKDPVSAKETARNNAVYGIQLNRNPFIDYPGLEQYIWGSKTDVAFSYDNYVQPDGSSSGSGTGNGSGDDPTLAADTYKLTITPDDFNSGGYAANNNEKTSTAVCITDETKTFEVKWTSYQVMRESANSTKIQWQKGSGYIYNSTDLGTIQSVTVSRFSNTGGTFTVYYGASEQPSSSTDVGDGFFEVKVNNDDTGKTTKIEVVFTIAGGDTPDPNPDPVDEGGYFTKLTSMDNFEDGGTYLIVCESESKAFNGALDLLDVANNNISVTIADNKIEATPTIMASTFTIATKTAGGYSIKSASGYYVGNTSDANSLKRSAEDKYTNDVYFGIIDGNVYIVSSSSYLRYNKETSDNRFRYYKSGTYTSQQAIQLYKYIAPAATSQIVEIGKAGYATMVADANLVIPSGVQAFAVQVKPGYASAFLVPVTDGIPQGEAVVIKASEGTYNFLYTSNQVDAIEENDLVPATMAVTADGSQYCLAYKNNTVGFYRVQEGVKIPKGKAYLEVTTAMGVEAPEFYGFSDEDDATAISDELRVKSEEMEGAAYNLAGQRVDNSKLPHGIYIVGGRKVLK